MKTIILCSFFAGLLLFNLSFSNGKSNDSSLSLQNVKLMQANAVEATCDASHTTKCTIEGAGGVVGTGTGDLIVKY